MKYFSTLEEKFCIFKWPCKVFFSHKITCYFHIWRYHVFLQKLTWYCIGVYIISDRIQCNIVIAERRHPLGNSYCKGSRLEWSHGSCEKNFCGKQKYLNQNTVEHWLMTTMFPWQQVITTKCLWPLHWSGCVMAVQFHLLIFQITLICAPWNLMLPKNSLLMIHSIIRLHDSRFFSKNWVDVAQVPSLALCFQPRSRPFVWLLARTWIFKKYGLFCSLQHYNQTLQTKTWILKNC